MSVLRSAWLRGCLIVAALLLVLGVGDATADTSTLRIRALDARGRPLAGAKLVAAVGREGSRWRFDARAPELGTTDAKGVLELDVAETTRRRRLVVWAPEHAPVLLPAKGRRHTVRLLAARASRGIILRSRRKPASARDVIAIPASAHADLVHLTRTDEKGAYAFPLLHAGAWTILLRDGRRGLRPVGSVRAGDTVDDVLIGRATSLKGRILDTDGTRGASVGAVALQLIPLDGDGTAVRFRTEKDGSFLVAGLEPGVFEVQLDDPAWVFEPTPPRVEVERGRARDLAAWFALRRQRVLGRVQDEDGKPLQGVGIRLVPEPGRPLPAGASPDGTPTVRSDPKGGFAVPGVAPGEGYRLIATAKGRSPFVSAAFRVDRAEATTLKPFRMRKGWRIELRVRNLDGGPVASAQVVAASARRPSSLGDPLWQDTVRRGRTDGQGTLVMTDLPEDDVLLRVAAPGFQEGRLVVPYPRISDARRAELVLHRAVELKGQLTVPEGGLAGPFEITATRRDGVGKAARAVATPDGRFRFPALAPTLHDLQVDRVTPGARRRLVTVEGVVPGTEELLEIALPELLKLAGIVEALHLDAAMPRVVVETRRFDTSRQLYVWKVVAEAALKQDHTRATFAVGGLPPGAYAVRVVQGALDTGTEHVVLDEGDVDGLTLRMPTGARIAGAVRDPDGDALLGARVRVTRMHGAHEAELRTKRPLEVRADDRGDFMFEQLAPGMWRVEASDDERASDVRVVRIQDGEILVLDDLVLGEGAQLEGDVQDAEGRPLDGVHVHARRYDGDGQGLVLRTDADGTFRARNLRAGAWLLTVDAETVAGGPWIEALVEAVDGETVTVNFTASEDGAIGGTVRRRGTSVAGAVVDLVHDALDGRGSLRRYRATTGPDGRFRVEGLEAGLYTLQLQSGAWRSSQAVQLEPSDDLELDLESFEARLRGQVVTRDGRRVGGALVRAVPLDEDGRVFTEGGYLAEGRSDPQGQFTLHGLPAGPYVVTVSAAGLPPGRFDGASADLPGADFPIEVVLGRGGDIALRVIDENDRGVTGARVWLEDEQGVALHRQPYVTGAAGRLRIEGVASGTVRMRVHAKDLGRPALRTIVVEEGGEHPVTLRMLPAGGIRLTVTGEGSDPLFRARIDIVRAGGGEIMARRLPLSPIRLGGPWGWVPRTGVVTIAELEAGRYVARISAGREYAVAEVPIEVKTGLTAEVGVTLAPR